MKKRILSLLLALMMVLNVFTPAVSAVEGEEASLPLIGSSDAAGLAFLDAEPMADFIFEANLKVSDGNQGGLMFRASQSDKAEGMTGYFLGIFSGEVRLLKTDGGPFPYVMSGKNSYKSMSRDNNKVYNLKVVANGANFKAYVDGNLMFDVTDTEATDNVPVYTDAGVFGVRTYNSNTIFYDVKISDLDGNVVYEEDDLFDHLTYTRGAWRQERNTIAKNATASASYENGNDKAYKVNDGGRPRWTAYNNAKWNKTASDRNVWIQYDFGTSGAELDGTWVTWYDDGGGVLAPEGVVVEYWDGAKWVVAATNNQISRYSEQYYGFDNTIVTNKIRLMPYRSNTSKTWGQPGIVEWAVDGVFVDKSALQLAVDTVNDLNKDDYSDAFWAELQETAAEAQTVLNNVYASQEAVDTAVAEMNALLYDLYAARVSAMITAIGTVNYGSGAAIKNARAGYDALDDVQKEDVANYQTLVDAEAAFQALCDAYVPLYTEKVSSKKEWASLGFLDAVEPMADFVFEADVQIHSGSEAGLMFRAADSSEVEGMSGYYLGIFSDRVRLLKCNGKSFRWVNQTQPDEAFKLMTRVDGKPYHLKVVAEGANFKAYVDGVLMFDVIDTDTAVVDIMTDAGLFGLRTYNAAATYTNVMVSKLDGTVVYDEADMTDDITFTRAMWLFLRETGLAMEATATASGACGSDPATNLNNSAISRWNNYGVSKFNTNANDRNTWVQYEWQKPVTLDAMRLTWMDDNGGVQTPEGFCIEYWSDAEDGKWVKIENVVNGDKLPVNKEVCYSFEPVTSTKFRIVPYNAKTTATYAQPGIYEWAVEGAYADISVLQEAWAVAQEVIPGLKQEDYTEAAWQTLQSVLANVRAAVDSVNTSTAQAKTLATNLDAILYQLPIDHVEKLIDAIGEVTKDSGAAIRAARKAYNALDAAGQAEVSNVNVLIAAENAFAAAANSKRLTGKSDGPGLVFLDAEELADFTYEAKIAIHDGNEGGIMFRSAPSDKVEGLTGYYLGFFKDRIRLLKTDGKDFPYVMDDAGTKAIARKNNQVYDLKVVANGANFKVYLDGELMFDVTDTDAARVAVMTEAGSFGIRTYNGTMTVYGVKISDAEGNLVYDETDLSDNCTFTRGQWIFVQDTIARDAATSTPTVNPWGADPVTGLNDGLPIRYTNYAYDKWNATAEDRNIWVEYSFGEKTVSLSGMWITWMHDGGGVKVPQGFVAEYWDGENWVVIPNITNADKFPENENKRYGGSQFYGFEEITTNKIRLVPYRADTNKTNGQVGIYEWELMGAYVDKTELLAAVDAAAALVPEEYSEAAWAAVAKALEAAQAALNDVTADTQTVNAAAEALNEALLPLPADRVEVLIDAIGEVTTDSKLDIEAAQEAYAALTDEQKAEVDNYTALQEARAKYNGLKKDECVEIAQAAQESAEAAQAEAEKAQAAAEEAQAKAEAAQAAAETAKAEAEAAKAAAEEAEKSTAEDTAAAADAKAAAEAAEEKAQAAKAAAESALDKAETALNKAKDANAAAEEAAAAAEAAAASAEEADMAAVEDAAKTAEAAAKVAENAAKVAESARNAAANEAAAAEAAAESAGYAAVAAEAAKNAQLAQAAAEEAKAKAEAALKDAEEAKKAAEAEKAAAEAARKAAEEAALKGAKYQAILTLDTYAENIEGAEALAEIISIGKAQIAAAETVEEVNAALESAKAAVDSIDHFCPSDMYTDVSQDAWYHEYVDFMVENGYMKGVATTKFDVNGSVTRAQLVTILYRTAGEPSVEGLENPFTDVEDSRWYTDAIVWAANEGIVNGMTATTFEPNTAISRQQIVTILYRYNGSEKVAEDKLAVFTDADEIAAYAADAMNWAVAEGIMNGVTATTLEPTATATRAQICAIVMRYLEK